MKGCAQPGTPNFDIPPTYGSRFCRFAMPEGTRPQDRPNTRKIFVGKVASLLEQGVCVSLVDLVTVRQANLYAELLTLLGRSDPALAPTPPHLYAVTLHTRKPPKRRALLDAWFYPMTVGELLPTLPIWLNPELRVMLPLEPSYQETCRILGIV